MIAHSEGFKDAYTKLGRVVKAHIDYYLVVYNLQTEDNKLLITQDNAKLLTELMETEQPSNYLTEDDIISLRKNNLGELFRTYMKSYDLETFERFNVGDKMIIKIGTDVNNEPEYLNYGLYYVYAKDYNEDTQTYTYTLCDRMLFTMQQYNNSVHFGENVDTLTCKQLIQSILVNQCGFTTNDIDLDEELLVNYDKTISKETFEGLEMTCRDVLDMILQVNGCSLVIGFDNETNKDNIYTKTISTNVVDTLDDDILNADKVKIGDKFGKINSLLFSRSEGLDNIERKNQASIDADGETQYVIKDNLILDQENRVDYIDNLFAVMDGLEYYVCDIDTIGVGYIEYLDRFNISANGNLYRTICLKNTGEIQNGIKESFETKEAVEKKQTFTNIGKDDKTASIIMDKLKGEIVLKTYVDSEDGKTKLSQVRLDSSGEEGSLIEIGADNIKLEGTTTINERFKIDNNGYMYAKAGGEIAGWKISDTALYKDVRIGDYDYRVYIQSPLQNYTENSWIFSTQKKHKDSTSYGSTAIIKMGGDISGKNISANGNISIGGKLSGYLNLNDAKNHWIGEYGMYFSDETFTMQGVNDYTKYTNNVCSVNGQGHFNGYVYGWNFYSTSSVKSKKNIKQFKDRALDIVKNTDIYNYNFENEEKNVKKHIGFVIGDGYNYDERITNNENEGVDLYSFVSVCCKAIQEQQEQIDELKKEIETLKGGNK